MNNTKSKAAGFAHSAGPQGSVPGGLGSIPAQGLPQVIFPPDSTRPCFVCYDEPFLVGNRRYDEGVYHHYIDKQEDPNGNKVDVPVNLWILSVVRVLHIVRTDFGNEHGYLIEYVPHGKTEPRRMVLRQSLLLGRADEALKALRDHGISVLRSHTRDICTYLDTQHLRFSHQRPEDFWVSVPSVGWAQVGKQFVLPDQIIGQQTGVWFSGKSDVVHYDKKGEASQWKTQVAELCKGNPNLILALSCAFAGPLLEPLNIPGLGFHYYGDSTTGKSTALYVASSAWGSEKYLLSWRTTVNGLEIQAASRSSTLITLDESHMTDAKALDASIYLLLNGISKTRMNKDASAKEVARWRVCVLSSGERSVETHLAAAHIDHKAGQGIRVIDLPVTGKFGLFDDLHGSTNGSVFADKLRDASAKYYGHAGPLFVERLIEKLPNTSLQAGLNDALNMFADKDNPLNPQETRVARSFAIAALAGELASKWDILPWSPGDAKKAAAAIFKTWRASQPKSPKGKEHAQISEIITNVIDKHGAARFLNINWTPTPNKYGSFDDMPVIHDQLGYWEDSQNSRIYLFTPGGLKEAIGNFSIKRVLDALEESGALTEKGTGSERAKRRRTPDGRTIKLYHIDPSKLDA